MNCSFKTLAILSAFALTAVAGILDNAPFRLRLPDDGWKLDDAPFRPTLPDDGWKLDDAKEQSVSNGVFRVAYASNDKTQLRTVVTKTDLKDVSSSSLDQFAASIREPLTNHQVQVTETKTTFVGRPARHFVYEMKIGNETLRAETVVFIEGKEGWTVAAIGPAGRDDEIKQVLKFYTKK